MSLNLRPYQRNTIDAVKADWDAGYSDVMVTAATGAGKTVIFLALLDEVLFGRQRALILAHRKELIDQPYERIAAMFPQRKDRTGIVMADRNDAHAQIVIATVQTLGSEKRLGQLLANGQIDYLVIDEAHHATADAYTNIVAALKDVNPDLRHLGVTATPIRADRQGLRTVYQKESAHYGIKELVKLGYLAPPRWLAIQTGISLADVRSHGSGEDRDFNQGQLRDVFETSNCFDLVVETHKKYASDRPSIAFTVSVEGAYALAEAFRNAGIPAAAADGTTGKSDRQTLLRDFRSGHYQVLCNVALWTEGLDLPELSCVHQVRPTQSDGLYTQMIGRGLRVMPGKTDCIAEGQRVLTDCGLVPIENVTTAMRVWDGESFVAHEGAICKGYQEVITYAGLTATADHKVWTDGGWSTLGDCAANGIAIVVTGNRGTAIREADGCRRYANSSGQREGTFVSSNALHHMRYGGVLESGQRSKGNRGVSNMRTQGNTGARDAEGSEMALQARSGCTAAVHESERQSFCSIRRKGNRVSLRFASCNGRVGNSESWLAEGNGNRPNRQRRSLRGGQSALGASCSERCQQHEGEGQRGVSHLSHGTSRSALCGRNPAQTLAERDDLRGNTGEVPEAIAQTQRRVWDILNAGPNHRFTVEGLLVSNCLILDYAPRDTRNIAMLGDVLGVDAKRSAYIKEDVDEGEVAAGFTFDGETHWMEGNPMEIVSRALDYLDLTPWRWQQPQGKHGPMILGLGKHPEDNIDRTLVITPPAEVVKAYLVAKGEADRWARSWEVKAGTFDEVSEWAAEYAERRGAAVLASKQRRWMANPPTEGQITFARRLGVWKDEMTRGQCADAITAKLALDAVRRGGVRL